MANAEIAEEERPTNQPVTAATVAAAGLTAITLYLVGMMVQDLTGFPAPVLMLFTAVALKLLRAVSTTLREGAGVVYRFFAQVVTYPLLFAIGIALTPWDALVATLRPEILITIVSTVGTIMGTGFIVGRWVNLYPIESAIVNACHSGQGRHRRRGNPDRYQPNGTDAVRADRHAHRWCNHCDDRYLGCCLVHLTVVGCRKPRIRRRRHSRFDA